MEHYAFDRCGFAPLQRHFNEWHEEPASPPTAILNLKYIRIGYIQVIHCYSHLQTLKVAILIASCCVFNAAASCSVRGSNELHYRFNIITNLSTDLCFGINALIMGIVCDLQPGALA